MDERPSLNNTLTLELLRKKLEQHALRGRSERLAYQELATLIQQLTDRKHAPEAPIPQDIQDVAHQKLLDLSAVKIKIVANDEPLSSPVTDDFQPLHSSAQWVFLNNCQQHPAFKNDRRVQALLAKWKPLHDVSSPYYLKMFDSLFDDYEQWIIQKSNNNLQALNSCPPTDDIISLKIAIKESITFYDHAQMLFPNHWSDFQTLQTKIAQELQKWHALQSLPLSSWRVHIAPYLHQDTIQFEIKERIRSHIPAAFAENMTDFVEEIYQGLSIQEKADLLHNTELASPSDRKSLNQTHDKIYQAIISQLLRQHPQLQDWEYIAQCAQSLYLAKEQSYFLMHAYKGFHALSENAPGEKILFLEKLDKHLSSAQDQIFKKEINSKRLNDIKNSIQNEANDKNISTQEWFSHIHKEPSHSKNEAAFYYARIGLSTYAALYLKENVTEEELLQALEHDRIFCIQDPIALFEQLSEYNIDTPESKRLFEEYEILRKTLNYNTQHHLSSESIMLEFIQRHKDISLEHKTHDDPEANIRSEFLFQKWKSFIEAYYGPLFLMKNPSLYHRASSSKKQEMIDYLMTECFDTHPAAVASVIGMISSQPQQIKKILGAHYPKFLEAMKNPLFCKAFREKPQPDYLMQKLDRDVTAILESCMQESWKYHSKTYDQYAEEILEWREEFYTHPQTPVQALEVRACGRHSYKTPHSLKMQPHARNTPILVQLIHLMTQAAYALKSLLSSALFSKTHRPSKSYYPSLAHKTKTNSSANHLKK